LGGEPLCCSTVMVALLKEFPTRPTERDIMQKEERTLKIEQNLLWLPQPNEVRTVLSSQLPPAEMIATALVLAFDRDRLLQTHLVARGWDIVGGHIEPGETPVFWRPAADGTFCAGDLRAGRCGRVGRLPASVGDFAPFAGRIQGPSLSLAYMHALVDFGQIQ